MIRSLAIASASLVLLIAAASASAQTAPADATAQAKPDMVVNGETEQDDRDVRSRTCLRSTGSFLVATRNARAQKTGKPQRCAGTGRVYTRSDLENTGHGNIVDALRMLDTSIR
jgi:uncharacterized protein (DUF1800 family)